MPVPVSKLPTVADRLTVEIESQQSEVDRLTQVATIDLPAAQSKLDALKQLAGEVTPEFEAFSARLATAKIETAVNIDPVIKPKV